VRPDGLRRGREPGATRGELLVRRCEPCPRLARLLEDPPALPRRAVEPVEPGEGVLERLRAEHDRDRVVVGLLVQRPREIGELVLGDANGAARHDELGLGRGAFACELLLLRAQRGELRARASELRLERVELQCRGPGLRLERARARAQAGCLAPELRRVGSDRDRHEDDDESPGERGRKSRPTTPWMRPHEARTVAPSRPRLRCL
jgi:hypothetical protein